MKKFICLIAICITTGLLFTSCGKASENINPQKYSLDNFKILMEAGDYAKAGEMYFNTVSGNLQRENEVSNALKTFAEGTISSYLSDATNYDNAKMNIDTVNLLVSNTNMQSVPANEYTQKLEQANTSKVAYDSGINLLDMKNYSSAIEEFKKVIETDSRYTAAQEKLTAAIKAYKEEAVAKAKEHVAAKDYENAAAAISNALTVLPEDTDLLTMQNTYMQSYVKAVLEQADSAFVNPGEDYIKASDILKPAMQKYPDNTNLKEKYDYYLSFQPVSLFDMEPYTYEHCEFGLDSDSKDNMGNTYDKVMYGFTEQHSETYDIGKKYNHLSAIVSIADTSAGSKYTGTLKIYGDGNLLWEDKNINGSYKPRTLSVDVTGITDLKIEMHDPGTFGNNGIYIQLANITLQKTVK